MRRFPWISLVLLLIGYISFGWYLSGLESSQSNWLITPCQQLLGAPSQTQQQVSEPEKASEFHSKLDSKFHSKPHSETATGEDLHGKSKLAAPESSATSENAGQTKPAPEPHATPESQGPESKPQESTTVEEHAEKPHNAASPDSESAKEPQGQGNHAQEGENPAIAHQPHNICNLAIKHNLPSALVAVGWILFSSMMFMSPLSSFSRFINRWFQSDTVAFMTVFLIAGITTLILFWLHIALQILTILAAEALTRIDIQIRGLSGVQAFWILTLISLTGLAVGWLANGVL